MKRKPGKIARKLGADIHDYLPDLHEALRREEISRRDFLRTGTLLGLSASAAYGLSRGMGGAIVPAAHAQTATPQMGGTLRVGNRVFPIADPHQFSSGEHNITRYFVEYLAETGVDNITRPWLLESWEASSDLTTWTLNLRQGVRWNNGDAFTSEDVAYNFRRWIDPNTGSSSASLFSALPESGIEVIDPHTVRLNLTRPELAIPENLFQYTCAILHHRFDEEGGDLTTNPVGTGPYQLDSYEIGEVCSLVKRDPAEYWGPEVFIDRITIVDVGDGDTAKIAALASDQVDIVHEISTETIDVINTLPNIELYEAVTAYTGCARMQNTRAPFDNRLVRQAVVAATDNAEILQLAFGGRGIVAENHHVSPIHPEYAALPPLARDVERSRALLAEAGYADGLNISIDFGQNEPWIGAFAQVLSQQLEPAGINLELNTMPQNLYWDIWTETPFGITSWSHRPLGVMVLNLAYRSGAQWNESGYNNPDFDAALDEASGILDVAERTRAMEGLQQILQDDAVMVQPFWRSVFTAANARVQNFQLHPTLAHMHRETWIAS